MLEERSDPELAEQFNLLLALPNTASQPLEELQAELHLAGSLSRVNLGAESKIQDRLRDHLARRVQGGRPARWEPILLSPRLRLWISAGFTALIILLLAANVLVFTSLRRLSGDKGLEQTRLAPAQVLTMAGNIPTNTRTAALPLYSPVRNLDKSPTPGAAQITPNFPSVVPTPGEKPPD